MSSVETFSDDLIQSETLLWREAAAQLLGGVTPFKGEVGDHTKAQIMVLSALRRPRATPDDLENEAMKRAGDEINMMSEEELEENFVFPIPDFLQQSGTAPEGFA